MPRLRRGEAVMALLMSRFRSSATTGASYVQAWFESGPEPFRSTISPVKSEGLYHLSYRPTQGGLCPKRTRTERTGHPVARGGGRCSDIAGDWMSVWRPVASGSLWPLRVGLSPFQQKATIAAGIPFIRDLGLSVLA